MALAEHACRICGERELEEIPEFGSLARVTSDCKPFAAGGRIAVCGNCGAVQKPADAQWHADANTIYRAYEVYFQSGGVEQAVFDPAKGTPRLRSAVLLDRLDEASPQPQTGKVLDVGCGNGALLSAFAAFRPRWQLWGHELSALNEPTLSRIPGFSGLYTGALADLPPGFDVITMMHSLEHFPEPLEALRALRPKLAEHGCMLIEVPDAEATPFDLLVADHASHFTQRDLARLLARAGLGAVALRNDWVTKELSAVAVPAKAGAQAPPPRDPREALRRVQAQIGWLHDVRRRRAPSRRSRQAVRTVRHVDRRNVAVRTTRRTRELFRRRGPEPYERNPVRPPDPQAGRHPRRIFGVCRTDPAGGAGGGRPDRPTQIRSRGPPCHRPRSRMTALAARELGRFVMPTRALDRQVSGVVVSTAIRAPEARRPLS